ncbi:hypothetical protein MUO83_06210 [Candidatus Bathyarchaeota archaeon]|jgi:hypothetical protein|nr:hypothetical protein [Candidatus Bathyarchaeota archaeon]
MSETEKIGEDILGGAPPSRMPIKKRRELEQKLKKELAKKKRKEQEEEDNIKLPKLPIPNDQHELSRLERAEIEQRARLTGISLEEAEKVYVREHLRNKPKKKKSLADTIFEFP